MIGVGFLMADAVAQVAKRFPKTKFAIIDNSGVAAELKGKPTNVRGLLFKEQEAGYLVGFLAGQADRRASVQRPDEARRRRRPQDPAGGPLHRGLLRRCEAGQLEGHRHALLLAGLRRPGEVQGAGAEPDRQRRRRRLPGRRPVRSRRPLGGEGEGCLRHRRRRRPGLPRLARDDERHQEGRRRGLPDDRGGEEDRAMFQTNFNAIFTVANGGVGYGKISPRISPDLRKQVEAVRKLIAAGQDQEHPAGPARNHGLGATRFHGRGGVSIPPLPVLLSRMRLARLAAAARAPARCSGRLRQRRRDVEQRDDRARDDGGDDRRRAGRAGTGIKIGLVTDIGGLDDRSFNFLANKGLQRAERELGVDGPRRRLEVGHGLRPEPDDAREAGLRPRDRASAS